jgi:hypothetical protein
VGAAEEFVENFARDLPGFDELLSIHLENQGVILPHVFFGLDVVPATLESYLGRDWDGVDWRSVLSYLEGKFRMHIREVDGIIVTSFLYNLPYEGQPGAEIARFLGPEMKAKFAELRAPSR